ncbi:hypothetical protein PO124_29435 [Bacillus licheniformis]|nr:hypothetical protein [Bacillus licheniformis]
MNALNGLCRALFEPTSRALLSDVSKPETRLSSLISAIPRSTSASSSARFRPVSRIFQTTLPFSLRLHLFIYAAVLVIQFKHHTVPAAERNKRIKVRDALEVTKQTGYLRLR